MVTEGRGSIVKCRETSLEGEGFLKILQDSSINDGNQNGTENQKKRGRYGVGIKIKMTSNVARAS